MLVAASSCFLCSACRVSGGNNGKLSPAPAARPAACWKLCRLWSKAAECSWALRLSSATLDDRWSLPGEPGAVSDSGRSVLPNPEMGFIGQHEHNPGKAGKKNKY